jgi:hypothetical protein
VQSAVAKLAGIIVTHHPKAAVRFEKQAVISVISRRNIGHGQRGMTGQSVQEQWNQSEFKDGFHTV